MELILWRHADAEDGMPDLERKLTKKGRKQAERVAQWLLERLPEDFKLLSSPAARARETAEALGVKMKIVDDLAPGASVQAIVKAAGWPHGDATVVVVGHQPDLGSAVAHLVARAHADWSIKKGGLWWLAAQAGELRVEVRAVVSPDLL